MSVRERGKNVFCERDDENMRDVRRERRERERERRRDRERLRER